MKNKKYKPLPLRTRIRYVFLGKYPLERKYAPKIIEFIFMSLTQAYILFATILIFYLLNKYQFFKDKEDNLEKFIQEIKSFEYRLFFTALFVCYLVFIVLGIHAFYILDKTEEGKIFTILAFVFGLLFLSIFSILFSFLAYWKNEIVYE
ncbi:hypothetical protein V2E24_01645 [Mycoplasmopsis ciconiae]|uniref:Uncharacterized protein n=1 Tax=Mycoplasmopsis ciconiae TaxID=561067 RepID=A0ABU7ML81_9BACT|nr:hypothetical protein [Mycoplasmopsis ciconiae]